MNATGWPAKRLTRYRLITPLLLGVFATTAAAQVECPVLSSTGASNPDGTLLVLGELSAGIIVSGAHVGVVSCWTDDGDTPLPGDLNCDGSVTVGDINPFVLALTDPSAYASMFPDCSILAADCTGDGQVTVGDINCFVALVTGI